MRIKKLTLRNFRNIEECSFLPKAHLNFLVGANGQGKTSIIESIGYLGTLRSFRGAKTEDVIRYGQEACEIACLAYSEHKETSSWETELKIILTKNSHKSSKTAFINGKPFKTSTQYLSQQFGSVEIGFHAVVFNPSDHDLVRGEPSVRRSYLDRVLAAEDLDYLKTLQKYQRVLEQRNTLLKNTVPPRRELVAEFSESMVRYGSILTLKRLDWLNRLKIRLSNTAYKIAPHQGFLKAVYISSWVPRNKDLSISNKDLDGVHFTGQEHQASLELLEQAFWKRLSELEEAELKARSSLTGPHRDDWTFFLGDQVLKLHGSQGEVRSALLALKLSEIELFRNQTGHRPLLLLDDFSSELDRERRAFLLRFLSNEDLQVFITSTEDSLFDGKRYWVLNGKISEDHDAIKLPREDGNDNRTNKNHLERILSG
jgi:DNA replication and repair protein RecF